MKTISDVLKVLLNNSFTDNVSASKQRGINDLMVEEI
jgi:hypothetical protein